MTVAEAKLIKRCILAWLTADGLVEVGAINGVDPRTARNLVAEGILAYDMPKTANHLTNSHVRLANQEELEADLNFLKN